jgi:hypothetical protein
MGLISNLQVAGLRETLESSDDEDNTSEAAEVHEADSTSTETVVLFGRSPWSASSNLLPTPTKFMRTTLPEVYHQRVDSVYKLLHWPTVIAQLEAAHEAPDTTQSPSEQALEFSIYFMALCSLTDVEYEEAFLGDRTKLIQDYQQAAEISIARADFLRHPTVLVLQAFVIYLVQFSSLWALYKLLTTTGWATSLQKLCNGLDLVSCCSKDRQRPRTRFRRPEAVLCIRLTDPSPTMVCHWCSRLTRLARPRYAGFTLRFSPRATTTQRQ